MNYLKVFICAFVLAMLMTPFVRKFAIGIGAVDIPKDSRRMHKEPIPSLGGLALYFAIFFTLFIFSKFTTKEILHVFIGSTLILISGAIDDVKSITPMQKLIVQIIAAIILIRGDIKISFVTNPFGQEGSIWSLGFLSYPASIIWIVGITNAINLIDGMDGLAAGVSMMAAISLGYVAYIFGYGHMAIIAFALAGACLGFLPYNFHPAKIFMGDTGALTLGFILSAISIEGVMKSVATVAMAVPIIILGIPIFDTLFAIIRRKLSGKSITSADKGHLHHRLLAKGNSQPKTVIILYIISALFGAMAIMITKYNSKTGNILALIIIIITIAIAKKIGMFNSKN
ncbi:MAG: MraY family glycosyltransferase [Tissierellia bacterium]|nr:MraY family glycosyltransferase [Tissierellia bacterium]